MANASIFAAFERMWQHIIVALNDRISMIEDKYQSRITGSAGDFVVIGPDGNVTTKTIARAEGVEF